MKVFKDPVIEYHREVSRIIGKMGSSIEKANQKHLKEVAKAVDQYSIDLEKIVSKYSR